MASWRLAKSLVQLRAEINTYAPKRKKGSDGTIGDAAHAARDSRHNPNSAGVVTALDITHDPANGMDCAKLFEFLRTHPHPDLAYIIHARRIASRKAGWVVKVYTGSNDHLHHIHIAVGGGTDAAPTPPYDDMTPWGVWKMGVKLETEAKFINRMWLDPHHSTIRGDMLVGPNGMRKVYGLEPLSVLAVTGAETSMGDPDLGGLTAEAHNYANIRWTGDRKSKWAELSLPAPVITLTGQWLGFRDAWTGTAALGRLLKLGPPMKPGFYFDRLKAKDWRGFYEVFYGKDVPGFEACLANLEAIASALKKKANNAGWPW